MSLVGATRQFALRVDTQGAAVAAFAASLGAPQGRVPTTYPIRWLTHPQVVTAVRELAADRPACLPVHELQTVELQAPLAPDEAFDLSVTATRTDDIHVTVTAEIAGNGGAVGRLHAVLRLVP